MTAIDVEAATGEVVWRIRYTWKVVRGLPHPEYTYEERYGESRAIDCAVSMIDRNDDRGSVYVVCAHIQAAGSAEWRQVEYERDY